MLSRIDSWHRKSSTSRYFQNGHHNIAKNQHFPISSQFDVWVDNDVPNWLPTLNNFYWLVAIFKMATTIPQKFNIVRYHHNMICGYIMMSQIDSRHWTISTGRHFQNGHHNTAKIQHCPISSKFDMWVDYDVPNWFLTLNNFYWCPFSKWPPQYHQKFNIVRYHHNLICG